MANPPENKRFVLDNVVIIGVGLIGGSLARALRRANAAKKIIGAGRNKANLRKAVTLGVVDCFDTNVSTACVNADMVVICTPIGAMDGVMRSITPSIDDKTVVTDVGSVKQSVVDTAREVLGERIKQFVPGHPIAGTENSGVDASFESLYDDRRVILTPLDETNSVALESVRNMWCAAGANVSAMDVATHDRILSTTSHLPHLLAFALVDFMAKQPDPSAHFDMAAGGFYDFTRIASSDSVMWRDIFLQNGKQLGARLRALIGELESAADKIEQQNGDALQSLILRANEGRQRVGNLHSHPNKENGKTIDESGSQWTF